MRRSLKFKVGDRVLVQSSRFEEQNGLTGEITKIEWASDYPYQILYDRKPHPYLEGHGCPTENVYGHQDLVLMENTMPDTREYLDVVTAK